MDKDIRIKKILLPKGWYLEVANLAEGLMAGKKYQLCDNSGKGGSLVFYNNPYTTLHAYSNGAPVLSFENGKIPEIVLKALLRKYTSNSNKRKYRSR